MAGGLYEGRPFAFNVKCILFTAALAGGYWFLPSKNLIVLLVLLWLPYVAMAWYDYTYDCANKMGPTVIPFGRYLFLPFKPDGYKAEYSKLAQAQLDTMDRVDRATAHVIGWTAVVAAIAFVAVSRK